MNDTNHWEHGGLALQSNGKPIHIVMIDDERLLVEQLAERLGREPDFSVVAATADVELGIRACLEVRPEIAILDTDLNGRDAFQAGEEILSREAGTRLLYLARYPSDVSIQQALRIRAAGFLLKTDGYEFLAHAIRQIYKGEHCFSPNVDRRLRYDRSQSEITLRNRTGLFSLTNRQLEVLRYLALGHSVKEVAKHLHLSEKSVDSHKYRIMNKLGIHDRVQLSRYAIREGLIEA